MTTHDAARAAARLSFSLWRLGRGEEALQLLEPALEVLGQDEPDENIARLAAEAGRVHHFQGDDETARERLEFALQIAEREGYPRVVSEALNTKAILTFDRPNESRALLREALAIALEHDLVPQALRAYNNLSVSAQADDRWDESRRYMEDGLELARARGDYDFVTSLGMALITELIADGEWDGAFALGDELPLESQTAVPSQANGCVWLARAAYERGDRELAERWLARIAPGVGASSDIQLRNITLARLAVEAIGEQRFADALPTLVEAAEMLIAQGTPFYAEFCLSDAALVGTELGDPSLAVPFVALFDTVPVRLRGRPVMLACARIRANDAAANGEHDSAADEFARGLAIGRNLDRPGLLAPLLLDYGRWLVQTGRSDEAAPLLDEARTMFEGMRATQWLDRLEQVSGAPKAEAAVT